MKSKQTIREVRTVIAEIPVEKFTGPTTEQMKEWEVAVADLDRKYQESLQKEVERLETQQADLAKARREGIKDWIAIAGSGIGTLLGLANLILGIRKDTRDSAAAKA